MKRILKYIDKVSAKRVAVCEDYQRNDSLSRK